MEWGSTFWCFMVKVVLVLHLLELTREDGLLLLLKFFVFIFQISFNQNFICFELMGPLYYLRIIFYTLWFKMNPCRVTISIHILLIFET